jgi:hypothetical protein
MEIPVSSPSSDLFQDFSPTVISRKANGGLVEFEPTEMTGSIRKGTGRPFIPSLEGTGKPT